MRISDWSSDVCSSDLTKAEVDSDIAGLISNFGNTTGVSGPIATVSQTWAPLAKNADDVIASEAAVLALAGNANRFTPGIPSSEERSVGKEGVRTCRSRW